MIEDLVNSEAQLTSLYKDAKEKVSSSRRPVLVSLTHQSPYQDPLTFYSGSHASHAFYWDQPDEQFAMAGVGAAFAIEPVGEHRFNEANSLWQEVVQGALIQSDTDALGSGPIAFGGFSFDPARPSSPLWQPFPPARLILPRFSLTTYRDSSGITINALVQTTTDPEAEAKETIETVSHLTTSQPHNPTTSQPQRLKASPAQDPAAWKQLVSQATRSIRQGAADKIVLARSLGLVSNTPLQPATMLQHLRETYPSCTLFAITSNQSTFLGASPERLARLARGQAQVDCVAGTTRRGSTPEEDDHLAAALSSDSKERLEHQVVVQVLREQLSHFCPYINMPPQPVILRLPNVQHLSTPLRCHLPNGENILQLVKAFHPSPAIGGFPQDAAMSFIREREELDRGWYGGPIGWIDRHGQGEFAVAIRSALIEQNEAHLFAGCGIMVDSDPDKEYQESDIKLESMLSALNGGRQ